MYIVYILYIVYTYLHIVYITKHTYTFIYIYIYMCIYHIYIHTYIFTNIYVWIHTHYMYIYRYLFECSYICTHVYIHIYTCARIPKYIHICIYIHNSLKPTPRRCNSKWSSGWKSESSMVKVQVIFQWTRLKRKLGPFWIPISMSMANSSLVVSTTGCTARSRKDETRNGRSK